MNQDQLPAQIAALVKTAPLPENYEAAKKAIAECERIDQCAEWADKAVAIASYARQADDFELEAYARRIRLRAVRRCGELLRTFDARGGDRTKGALPLGFARHSRADVAKAAGLTEHKARTAVEIAKIPEAEFEAAVEKQRPVGTTLFRQWQKLHRPERVRAVTQASLLEVSRSANAGRALEGLLQFEKAAAECGDLDAIVELCRGPGRGERLQRVRRAIGLAFRLQSALDDAGNRGSPMLRSVRTETT